MPLLLPAYAWEVPPGFQKKPVLRGEQTAGICLGHRDYIEGARLMLGCTEEDPWVAIADLTTVRHRVLKDVSKSERHAAGFVAQDELFQFFEEYHPGRVTWNSEVTVIRWAEIRGACVDVLRAADNARPK